MSSDRRLTARVERSISTAKISAFRIHIGRKLRSLMLVQLENA